MKLGDTVKTPTDLTGEIIKIIKSNSPNYPDMAKVQYSNGFTGYWPEEDIVISKRYEKVDYSRDNVNNGFGLEGL